MSSMLPNSINRLNRLLSMDSSVTSNAYIIDIIMSPINL